MKRSSFTEEKKFTVTQSFLHMVTSVLVTTKGQPSCFIVRPHKEKRLIDEHIGS